MIAIGTTLVLAFVAPLSADAHQAVDDEKGILALTEQLGSSDVAIRDGASKKLLAIPSSSVSHLRRALQNQSDPEVKARLAEIVRQLVLKEAKSLYDDAELDKALLKFAEVEGASDPAKFVKERQVDVRRQVQEIAAKFGERNREIVREVRKNSYGPWLMPVLLEALGQHLVDRKLPAPDILEAMGQEAVPHLCKALRSSNKLLQAGACATLDSMGARSYPKLPEALKFVLDDPEASPATKSLAEKMLLSIQRNSSGERK